MVRKWQQERQNESYLLRCIVDKHINAAELLHSVSHELLATVCNANVARKAYALAATPLHAEQSRGCIRGQIHAAKSHQQQ